MNLSLLKLQRYGFNRRPLTEKDFFNICETENITVLENIAGKHCFYFTLRGERFIVLGKGVRGTKRLFAMFHELAHHFLHCPHLAVDIFFMNVKDNKEEAEADALAAIALIPAANVADAAFLDDNGDGFARTIYDLRLRVRGLFGV